MSDKTILLIIVLVILWQTLALFFLNNSVSKIYTILDINSSCETIINP